MDYTFNPAAKRKQATELAFQFAESTPLRALPLGARMAELAGQVRCLPDADLATSSPSQIAGVIVRRMLREYQLDRSGSIVLTVTPSCRVRWYRVEDLTDGALDDVSWWVVEDREDARYYLRLWAHGDIRALRLRRTLTEALMRVDLPRREVEEGSEA